MTGGSYICISYSSGNTPSPHTRPLCCWNRRGGIPPVSTEFAFTITADILAIYEYFSKKFKILVRPHVLSEPCDFCEDRSMYANMAPRSRRGGAPFPRKCSPVRPTKQPCGRSEVLATFAGRGRELKRGVVRSSPRDMS